MLAKLNHKQKIGLLFGMGIILFFIVLHNPFGGYEVEEALYTKDEFMKMFRQRITAYRDMTDEQVYIALLNRYPEFKTWVIEESDGRKVESVTAEGQPLNLGLKPPPAYYGETRKIYSRNAIFQWIQKPSQFIGFSIPVLIFILIWFYIFRETKLI